MTDLFSRRSADLVGLRFFFIALKVFEVDNDSSLSAAFLITSAEDGAKVCNGAIECKSIHNRLQSVYNPFIIRCKQSL